MPDGLYEHDAPAWAAQQATLLRRLAAGERVNDAVDWSNVIEEVSDVGLSELRACQSLLQQAMTRLFKQHAWPGSQSAAHWRGEAGVFLDDAGQRFTPSMRQRIGLEALHAKALRRAWEAMDDASAPRALPAACLFMLDELLGGDIGELAGRLADREERP